MTIFIHFGPPKTGTSSVQAAFFGFSNEKLVYLNLPKANQGPTIVAAFSHYPEKYHTWKRLGISAEKLERNKFEALAQLNKAMSGVDGRDVLISGEDIFSLDLEGLRDFKGFLSTFQKDIRLIGFMRKPQFLYKSMVAQSITGMHKVKFSPARYKVSLENLLTVFGSKNIVLKHFEEKIDKENWSVVDEVAAHLSVDIDHDQKRVNQSASCLALKVFYRVANMHLQIGTPYNITKHLTVFVGQLGELLLPQLFTTNSSQFFS